MKRVILSLVLALGALAAVPSSAASYEELASLFKHSELTNKVAVACVIAADAIRIEDVGTPNHTNRLIWAKRAMQNPRVTAEDMLPALLAANKAAPKAAILAATDPTIQTAVDDAVDLFADGS